MPTDRLPDLSSEDRSIDFGTFDEPPKERDWLGDATTMPSLLETFVDGMASARHAAILNDVGEVIFESTDPRESIGNLAELRSALRALFIRYPHGLPSRLIIDDREGTVFFVGGAGERAGGLLVVFESGPLLGTLNVTVRRLAADLGLF